MTPQSPLPVSDDVVSPASRHPLATRDESEAIELRAEVNRRFAHRGWALVAEIEPTERGRFEIVIRNVDTPRHAVHCAADHPSAPVQGSPPPGEVAATVGELSGPRAIESRSPIMTSCGMEPVRPGWCEPP